MSDSIFIIAARNKYRFPSKVGYLTFEQLWDLPLQGGQTSLDEVGRALLQEQKEASQDTLLPTSNTQANKHLDNKIEIVKLVINTKLEEAEKRARRQKDAQERQRILQILDQKENEALAAKSIEELRAML